MAKEQAKPSAPVIHIVGLVKTAPLKYAVVTGTIAEPKVDTVSQPLEYAAEAAKKAWLKLMEVIP